MVPGLRTALRRALQPRSPSLEVRALGQSFPSPLGAAAGMDKDATWLEGLGALGFGFVEVGTVTAQPQHGNHGKRVWRLTKDRALLNRMGFPNPGAEVMGRRLRERRARVIVGVNVGKSMDTPLEEAGADYRLSVRTLAPLADFLVLNVSSPNTPGLRRMQAVEPLRSLISDVRDELAAVDAHVPLLVKIGPDLSNEVIDAIAALAVELELDGIVATNTTVERRNLSADAALANAEGGVSGVPLKARAVTVLERLHERVGGRLVLISVGGIETPEDAWQRILAGATLLQAYAGFVYGGPLWPSRINRGLARKLRDSEYGSLRQALGSATSPARAAVTTCDGGEPARSANESADHRGEDVLDPQPPRSS